MIDYINILENESKWLELLFLKRIEDPYADILDCTQEKISEKFPLTATRTNYKLDAPPKLDPKISYYANFCIYNHLTIKERVLLILGLISHIKPALLFDLFHLSMPNGKLFYKNCETGGLHDENFRGILPTGLTYIFLICGKNFRKRMEIIHFLTHKESPIFQMGVLDFYSTTDSSMIYNGLLKMHEDYLKVFLTNVLPDKPNTQNGNKA